MKILLSSFFALPQIGGLYTYMEQLKTGLEGYGHSVDIFCRKPETNDFYVLEERGPLLNQNYLHQVIESHLIRSYINECPQMPLWILNQETERYKFEAAAAHLDLSQYDVIHTQDILSTYCFSRVKPEDIPLFATLHASLSHEWMERNYFAKNNSIYHHYAVLLEHLGAASADRTIVPSKWLKNLFIEHFHVPSDNITVIPNAIDTGWFHERLGVSKDIHRPKKKMVFTCTSRLTVEKGIPCLLEACAKLKQKRKDWVLWLVGDGPLRSDLEKQARELGIQHHIKFWGYRNDIPDILRNTDIFLFGSLIETFCYSILEAQLAGVPVIAPETGGISELVTHEVTGLFYPVGSSEGLYENILRLLADHELRKKMVRNARHRALTKFSASVQTKRIIELYTLYL
ncbi:glycosyltransferase family 4 protein [Paenibacillus sp. CAA11]|uniref:glycosyltransferase family 4 protein n=1 Tax=Paenibacillus sp. CAA11 TaxID=1532905 RepID=UPI00131F3376|nr:glycosyltransferase family 4 protein [Paenibacillus sp. CAA11]